jgi:hypothetical protein
MAKKITLIILGLVLFIVGLAVAAVGGVALGFGGRSGVVQSGYHDIGTPTSAFVSDPNKVRDRNQVQTLGDSVTVIMDGRDSPKPLFIGVGPASQVDAYLNGVSYDEVTELKFGNFRLDTSRVNGTGEPAAPGDQSFWVAKASGLNPQMRWRVTDGDYRVVVMNADASPNVALRARVGLKIKNLFGIGLGAALAGGLIALLGLGLLIWGIAARRKRDEDFLGYPGPYPPYPPPGPGQPGTSYAPSYPAQPTGAYPQQPPPPTQPPPEPPGGSPPPGPSEWERPDGL